MKKQEEARPDQAPGRSRSQLIAFACVRNSNKRKQKETLVQEKTEGLTWVAGHLLLVGEALMLLSVLGGVLAVLGGVCRVLLRMLAVGRVLAVLGVRSVVWVLAVLVVGAAVL